MKDFILEFNGVTLHSPSDNQLLSLLSYPTSLQIRDLHFIAVSSINASNSQPELRRILNDGYSIVDSKPLALALRMLGYDCRNMRGTDFLRLAIESERGMNRHFFIGSTQETIEKIRMKAATINRLFEITGSISPDFRADFADQYKEWNFLIQKSKATIIWIGLGSPKQDFVAADLARHFDLNTIAVGAAFDFFSGTKKEAPRIFQRASLEWLYRLISEPTRLWRRYLIGNLIFLRIFAWQFLIKQFRSLK